MSDLPEWLQRSDAEQHEDKKKRNKAEIAENTAKILSEFQEVHGFEGLKEFVKKLSNQEFILLQNNLSESGNKEFTMESLITARDVAMKAMAGGERVRA